MVIDYDSFEEFRDPVTYDVECDHFDDDMPVIEQWAAKMGNPLLDLACGTGRMAIHMAALGYDVTGIDIVPEMINHGRSKAAKKNVAIDWQVADARAFHLDKKFPFIFMLMNAFQFLLTREDHDGLLSSIREHLQDDGVFMFETRNPSPRNLFEVRRPNGERFQMADGVELHATEEQYYDPLTQIQHYTRQLNFSDDRQKTYQVALRYVFPQEMQSLLFYNGFEIVEWYGNWQQDALSADSRSMIIICKKRK